MARQEIKARYLKLSVLEKQLQVLFGPQGYSRPKAINGMFELEVPQLLTEEQIKDIQKMSYPSTALVM